MRSTTARLVTNLLRSQRGNITNGRHQRHTAATVESNLNSQNDKYLHYTPEEGYIKTSPFENTIIPDVTLDKYVWRDFKLWENNVATVSKKNKFVKFFTSSIFSFFF